MEKLPKYPRFSAGQVVWYEQGQRKENRFFTQVRIEGWGEKNGRLYYKVIKLFALFLSPDEYGRKDLSVGDTIWNIHVDNNVMSFDEIQAEIRKAHGKTVFEKDILTLPYRRRVYKDKGGVRQRQQKLKNVEPPTSTSRPHIDSLINFFHEQSGGLRNKLLATAKHFQKEPFEVALQVQKNSGVVIPDRLIEMMAVDV